MDIRFYKEQQRNYMVMKQEEEEDRVSFHKKMMESVSFKSLLNVRNRTVDGETYNYYEISSCVSLRQLFGSRYMDADDFNSLIRDIRDAYEEMDNYLMDSDRIIISPDYIFYSYSKLKYEFIYNISTSTDCANHLAEEFMDYLLERTSSDDKESADRVYRMYEMAEKVDFAIWKILDIILPDEMETEKGRDIHASTDETKEDGEKTEILRRDELDAWSIDSATDDYVGERKSGDDGNVNKGIVSLAVLGAAGVLICVLLYLFMNFNKEESIILIAGGGASLFVSLLCGGLLLFKYKSRVKIRLQSFDSTNDDFAANEDGISEVKMKDFMISPLSARKKEDNGPAVSKCTDPGKTVLFEPDPETCPYKLFATDKKNKQHILLEKYPFTIGKMSGYVDSCIEHPSISRLHARIELVGGTLYISDLNSTNGVYLNGIRLNPNESRILDVGDEIRLGSLNYCLRY